jgi:hypothetical protein
LDDDGGSDATLRPRLFMAFLLAANIDGAPS